MLISRIKSRVIMETVFISWAGPLGQRIAESLGTTIFSHPKLKPWVSSTDITTGANWFAAIDGALTAAKFGIGIMTPGSSSRPWMNFEAGYIFSRLSNFKLLRFHEDVTSPLTQLQSVDGTSRADLTRVLGEMLDDRQQALEWIDYKMPQFEAVLQEVEPELRRLAKLKNLRQIEHLAQHIYTNPVYRENACMEQVVDSSIERLVLQLNDFGTSYSVPASAYPYYLVKLQKLLKAKTRAVALVNQHETFWQESLGREILLTSQAENERVFVFTTPEEFERHFHILVKHAERYTVRAISYENLTREFHPFNKDFSIVEASASRVLATYDHSSPHGAMIFSADPGQLDVHQKAYRKIARFSHRIEKSDHVVSPDEISELKAKIFGRSMTGFARKYVEMSAYIMIDDYDQHEERHAYYVDMMERMVEKFEEARRGRPSRVLEVGAGTGIFTRRLAAREDVNVEAIEIDWACFRRLVHNLQKHPNVVLYNEDSRTYDPTDEFDFVFSSFAEHHIRFEDREVYLDNIKKNMRPGAVFIIGDEFLPPHDPSDRAARCAALETYHRHIISLAEDPILIELEEHALASGIEGLGDFKTSIDEYVRTLEDCGFRVTYEKIGPRDREDVGGVYVLVARL
jgi:SAM-dependent methyltransferase